ncbi:MAG: hypothetical protein ACTHO8_10435 [Solirubrobacterales bacterium]
MVVMTPRESWTDARLDDFAKRVDERFDDVDARFDRVEADIRELRQTMIHGFFVLIGIMVTGFLTLVGLAIF